MRKGYVRKRCVICGRDRAHVHNGFISTRGKCAECGMRAQLDNVDGIASGHGPIYQRWRLGIAISQYRTEVVGALFEAGEFTDQPSAALDEQAGRA